MEKSRNPSEKPWTNNPVNYSLLDTGMIEPAAQAYTDVFVQDEPMTCRNSIDPHTFLVYARHYIRHCADIGMSTIAKDPQTGECIGFALCCDLETDIAVLSSEMTEFLSFFPESVAIIDTLEKKYFKSNTNETVETLHLFQLGVRREYRGLNIAIDLIQQTCDYARERGFQQVIADCTNPVSCHTFTRCGFRVLGTIRYDSFRYNNQNFFAGLDDGISLVIREL